MQGTIPNIDGVIAAFQVSDGGLLPVPGQGDVSGSVRCAELMQNLWDATLQLPEAAMLIVSTANGTTVGLPSTGLIVLAKPKMNVGMIGIAARSLAPTKLHRRPQTANTPSATKFRKNVWKILSRLNATHIPRVYRFRFGEVEGDIRCSDGTVGFDTTFKDAAGFLASLRHASEANAQIAYTLADNHDSFTNATATAADMLRSAVDVTDSNKSEFDPDGWPLVCDDTSDFAAFQTMSDIAVASCEMRNDVGQIKLKALSPTHQVVLSGESTDSRSIVFSLPKPKLN